MNQNASRRRAEASAAPCLGDLPGLALAERRCGAPGGIGPRRSRQLHQLPAPAGPPGALQLRSRLGLGWGAA